MMPAPRQFGEFLLLALLSMRGVSLAGANPVPSPAASVDARLEGAAKDVGLARFADYPGCFLIFGTEPVLLHTLTGGGSGSGPFVTGWRRALQSAMDELCPGYRLETYPLERKTETTKEER